MATSRILVEEPLYEAFCEKLRDYALSLKVGDPTDPDVFIGPLIDERHCTFVQSQVDDAVAKGAALLCGGTHEGPFFRPTVLCNVDESMRIFYEESFAPVTSVIPVKDADEALAKCNDNLFGLSAAVLTHDLDRAMELGMKIEAGMVHINDLTYREEGTQFPLTVPEGSVFLMGDNRNHSTDSRDIRFGPLDERYLLGKALFCLYPFDHFGGV